MKKYISFFKIRFSNGLQYRAAAYAGIATQFAWGFLNILLFKAFYNSDSSAFPMTFRQLSSYVWLQQALLAMFMTWFMDNEIFSSITTGSVAYELARPMDIYNMWFVKSIATRLSKAFLRCFPILIIAAFLPQPFGMSLPSSPLNFFLFLVSALLGFLAVVAFCMLVYIATFKTLSPVGVRVISFSLSEFLSGAVIPLPFFPNNIRKILDLTPFASMQNLPFRIYIGNIADSEMLLYIAVQFFWLFVLVVLGKLWMKSSLKKVIIQGG